MAKIPAKSADFYFDQEFDKLPKKFVVADRREEMANYHDKGVRSPMDELPQSLGSHVDGWLGEPAMQNSPAAVFASVFLSPSKHVDKIMDGLEQIAKIEGQEWAERMLKSLKLIDEEKRGE